jgi:hypothetical protein
MKTEKVRDIHQKARFLLALMAVSMAGYFAARIIQDLIK